MYVALILVITAFVIFMVFVKALHSNKVFVDCKNCNYSNKLQIESFDIGQEVSCGKCSENFTIGAHHIGILSSSIRLVFVGVALTVIGLEWNPTNLKQAEWFSRCGSLITLLAVLAELSIINNRNAALRVSSELHDAISSSSELNSFLGIIMLIMGTVIWGFGDLIHSFLYSSS